MNTIAKRRGWRTLLALVLVPLLVAGTLAAGMWRFGSNLHRVSAAIVNNDEMVTLNGQPVPLGRQLAAALVDSSREQNFAWELADDAHAKAGLASGRYAAVVTIPKDFSARATSFAGNGDDARQASITIATSPVAGLAEASLGQSVADAAAQSINASLTGMYLDKLYVGFNDMGKQMVTVADGAKQLADGSAELTLGLGKASDGARQLADNGPKLASGADQLASGLETMAAKTAPMPGQLRRMASGASELSSGMADYSRGVDQYVDGVNSVVEPLLNFAKRLPDLSGLFAQLDPFMSDLPAKSAAFDAQVQRILPVIRKLLDDTAALNQAGLDAASQLAAAKAAVAKVASGETTVPCPADLVNVPGGCEAFAKGVAAGGAQAAAALDKVDLSKITALSASVAQYRAQIEQALKVIADASAWFKANAASISAQWKALRASMPPGTTPNDYLVGQLTRLRDGGNQLKDGGHRLSSGTSALADGVRQLSDGVPALVDGIARSAAGARQLADGVKRYADGTAQLASGIEQAYGGSARLTDGTRALADGLASGAAQIPSYTDTQRANLVSVVSAPISDEGLNAFVTPAVAAASLLLVLALWLGALATYTLIPPLDRRIAASSATTGRLLAKALLPGAAVASVQALALGALGAGVLRLGAGQWAALTGVLLVAGCAFVAVNHALAAWGGVAGRLVSAALLLVTAVTALTQTAPDAFGVLRPLSPASPALDAVRSAVTWQPGALAVVTLAGWLAVGVLAGGVRIARARTVPVKALALAS